MAEKLDQILTNITKLTVDTAVIKTDISHIKKDVSKNTEDLATHVKRTNLLEERIAQHAIDHDKKLDEALLPIQWFKTTGKIAAWLSLVFGAIYGVFKTLT